MGSSSFSWIILQKLLKNCRIKAVINKAKIVELRVCEKISDFLKKNFIDDLNYFEKKNKMKIDIISDYYTYNTRIHN